MVKKIVFLVITLLFLLKVNAQSGAVDATSYRVVSSILPWGDFLKGLCHSRCEVEILIPPGATPHTWSPRPMVMKRLRSARLFVYTNDCLEPWVKGFVAALSQDNKGYVFKVGGLLPEKGCGKDPHLWLDFEFDQRVVKALEARLEAVDPAGAPEYRKNSRVLLERLTRLDRAYRDALSNCKHKTMVIAGHNAFERMAGRYGLRCISVMGVSPDANVTPRGLTRVIEFVREEGVGAVFFDHAVTDRIARVISTETGAKALELSPGVALTREDLRSGAGFFTIMERNLRSIVQGLGCRALPGGEEDKEEDPSAHDHR